MLFSHKETWTEIRTAIKQCKQLQQIVRTSSSRRTEKGAQNCYKSARSPPNTAFDPQDDDIVKLNLNFLSSEMEFMWVFLMQSSWLIN